MGTTFTGFDLDVCKGCAVCAEVCPVDAITMSHEYELSVLERDGLIYTKTELAQIGGQMPNWWESGVGPDNQNTNAPTKYDRFRDNASELY